MGFDGSCILVVPITKVMKSISPSGDCDSPDRFCSSRSDGTVAAISRGRICCSELGSISSCSWKLVFLSVPQIFILFDDSQLLYCAQISAGSTIDFIKSS